MLELPVGNVLVEEFDPVGYGTEGDGELATYTLEELPVPSGLLKLPVPVMECDPVPVGYELDVELFGIGKGTELDKGTVLELPVPSTTDDELLLREVGLGVAELELLPPLGLQVPKRGLQPASQ
jgi:hypothetical protein